MRPSSTQRLLRFSETDLRNLRKRGHPMTNSASTTRRFVTEKPDPVEDPALTSAVYMRAV